MHSHRISRRTWRKALRRMNDRRLLPLILRMSLVFVVSAGIASCTSNSDGVTQTGGSRTTQRHTSETTTTSSPQGVGPGLTGTLLLSGPTTISALDLASSQLDRGIQAPGDGGAIAVPPDQDVAYTSEGDMLTEIDLTTLKESRNIDLPVRSAAVTRDFLITPDGSTAWVAGRSGVIPVDLATGRVGAEIEIGTSISMAISDDGEHLCVAVSHDVNASTPGVSQVFTYSLVTLNARTGVVESSIDLPNPVFGMALSSEGDIAYLLEVPMTLGTTPKEVLVPVNLDTGRSGQPIPLGIIATSALLQGILLSPDSSSAYLIDTLYGTTDSAGLLEKVDLQTGAIDHFSPPAPEAASPPGGAQAIAWDGGSTLLIAAGTDVFSFDTRSDAFSRQYDVGDLSVAAMAIWSGSLSEG